MGILALVCQICQIYFIDPVISAVRNCAKKAAGTSPWKTRNQFLGKAVSPRQDQHSSQGCKCAAQSRKEVKGFLRAAQLSAICILSNPKLLGLQELLFLNCSHLLSLFACLKKYLFYVKKMLTEVLCFADYRFIIFGYMLQYFVVFYFWFFGLTQANQLSLLR